MTGKNVLCIFKGEVNMTNEKNRMKRNKEINSFGRLINWGTYSNKFYHLPLKLCTIKKILTHNKYDIGVSQIVGTLLLLIIAVSSISVIYSQVLSDDGPDMGTIVKINGYGKGEFIYLEHIGGENIDLDNTISYSIAGSSNIPSTIGSLIFNNKEPLDEWNLGEELRIPINYNLKHLDKFQIADITGVDTISNSIIFYGPIELPKPTSDLSVDLVIEDENGPPVEREDSLTIIITLTSHGGDVNGSGGVLVNYKIPEGLKYISSYSPSGHNEFHYSPETGDWNVGNILVGYPAILEIEVTVNESLGRTPTQLSLVIDGSGSIMDYEWYQSSSQKHSGSYSARSDRDDEGAFRINGLNASGANNITIDFWFRKDDIESSNLELFYYNGSSYNYIADLDTFGSDDQWLHYNDIIEDSEYLVSNFKIGFYSSLGWGENVWVDDVLIATDTKTLLDEGFEGESWNWDVNWQSDWDMIRFGLANAISNNNIFPHDGSVELTIIQFGDSYAVVEVPPINITSSIIANNTADDIINITQRNGYTPIAAGFYLANDQLGTSQNFSSDDKQAVIIVTDGQPNRCSNRPFSNNPDGPYDSNSCNTETAKSSAENARDDLRLNFDMNNESDSNDEINVLAVGSGPDISWLNNSISWPNSYIWDIENDQYSNPGWSAYINSFEQFEFAINEMFKSLFSLKNTVSLVGSSTIDPNKFNNEVTVILG